GWARPLRGHLRQAKCREKISGVVADGRRGAARPLQERPPPSSSEREAESLDHRARLQGTREVGCHDSSESNLLRYAAELPRLRERRGRSGLLLRELYPKHFGLEARPHDEVFQGKALPRG